MSNNSSKLGTDEVALQTDDFYQTKLANSSNFQKCVTNGRFETRGDDKQSLAGEKSDSEVCEVAKKGSAMCAEHGETIAEFTLRAGGRVLNVAMHLSGDTDSHMEVLSSKRLSPEHWTHLYDQIQVFTHSMILLDHPDDNE